VKALILSTHTGGGHDAAANALAAALREKGVDSQVMDCVAFGGQWLSRVVSGTYVKMVQHVPGGFGVMYHASEKMRMKRIKSPVYLFNSSYAFRMERTLRALKPDIVACTHVFGSQSMTHLIHKGAFDGVHAMVMTDYTIHPFSEEVDVDALYIPHGDLRTKALHRGVKAERLRVSGIPVSLGCIPCTDKAAAKEAAGLDPKKKEVLLVGGSMGAGNLPGSIEKLLPALGETGHLTVVCGSNQSAREKAQERFGADKRVTILGRVSPLTGLMSAADILVTKPGGLTSTEAMTIGTPMVIVNPIKGCETANADFFERKGLALCARRSDDLSDLVAALLKDDSARRAMIAAQRREINPNAARQMADELIAMAQKKTEAR